MGGPIQRPDHEGLQSYNDESQAPEVVQHQKLQRRGSQDLPEAVPIEHESGKTVAAYYADHPEQFDGHYSVPPKYEYHEDHEAQTAQQKRKKRRKICIWVGIAVVALIVIIAAVVGGVVGSQASKNSSTPTQTSAASTNSSSSSSAPTSSPPASLQVLSGGGMAITTLDQGQQRFAYGQQKSGTIVEIPFVNNGWAFDQQRTVTTGANAGSSLAAATYSLNGTDYRIVAFITVDGHVMVTTASADNVWSQETSILTNDAAKNDGTALAVCADTDSLNGIRVYYASSKLKWIREVGLDLSTKNAKWTMYTNFTDADISSGVACSINNGYNHLYYRNGTQIRQLIWNYANVDNIWKKGAISSGSYVPSTTSDIAVTNDNSGTDYIFYRLGNQTVVRSSFSGDQNVFNSYTTYLATANTAEIAAAYLGSGKTGSTILEYGPVNGAGLTYVVTDSNGNNTSTGLLANWT